MFINNIIPTWLGEELLKIKNGNPKFFFWSGSTTAEDAPSYFQKLYRKVFRAAGIEESSYAFRHTFAIELLKSGVDVRSVSKALGHSSVTSLSARRTSSKPAEDMYEAVVNTVPQAKFGPGL